LKNVGIIAWKELRSYVSSPMAYVVTAVFLALSGASFVMYLAGTGYSDTSMRGFMSAGQILVLLFAAVLTMRLVAEERKTGTWELLLTSPVRDTEIVLGKFAGSLMVLTAMLVLTFYYPIVLFVFGDPDLGPIGTGYLGLLLLGSASLAVGIFASSLAASQVMSAVVAGGILFGLWLLGTAGNLVSGTSGRILLYLSLSYHFSGFIRGIVDTQAVVYYLSINALFLYMAIRSIEIGRYH
jgi:ABC-2 type transport system permease protein